VIRPASRADAVLALLFSMFFVTLGVSSFTALCWKVASDLDVAPAFPFTSGFLAQRTSWLCLAGMAALFARLIDAFAELLKTRPRDADELPAERPQHLVVVASE
jgi:hypothetical protein